MSAETGDQQQVSKGLLITLGVVAAIGVAAALWVFVLQPLSTDDVDTVAVEDDATEPGPELDAEPTPEPDGEPDDPGEDADPEDGEDADEAEDDALETTQVVNARDPFTQLATDTGGDGGTGGAATGGDSASGGGTATGDGDGDGDSGGDGDDQADVDSTTVTLVTIYTGDDGLQRAAVEVDEAGYDVLEGDTFAGNFQLLDIADECATMLYGDSRFTLCEGDRVRK